MLYLYKMCVVWAGAVHAPDLGKVGAITGYVGAVPTDIPLEICGDEIVCANPGIFEDLLSLLCSRN